MATEPTVVVTPKAAKLLGKGRVWLFADDLARVDAEHAQLVRVRSDRRELGLGWYSATSRLAVRTCGRWPTPELPAIDEFFAVRLAAALERRAGRVGPSGGERLVHGEADDLPGLVVDRYADCLVVQVTAAAIDAHTGSIVSQLVESCEPRAVIARNDAATRKLEGLPSAIELLHGPRVETVRIDEHGVRFDVDLFTGHKTGFYLDQRPARAAVRDLAGGARVLDLFCYQGAFALAALCGGATGALAVDQSESALQRARSNAELNDVAGLETRTGNAFDVLRELRASGQEFDLVVVDPPPFAKNRREVKGAERGYRELNRQALRVLAPGGWLVTCSCSYHMTPQLFDDVLRQAAAELPFMAFVRGRLMAGDDHPARLTVPETEYLKVRVLQRS